MQGGGETDTKKDIVYLLMYSICGCNGKGWVRMKTKAREFTGSPTLGAGDGAKYLGHLVLLSNIQLMGSRAFKIGTITSIWDASVTGSSKPTKPQLWPRTNTFNK